MTLNGLDKVIHSIESPFLVSFSKYSDAVYDFKLKGKKRVWDVRLNFNYGFPYSLPSATLLNEEVIGSIPHVNYEGIICVEESDTILLDYNREGDLILYFIEQVVRLLDRASLKIFRTELIDEFEGYFQSTLTMINSFYHASDVVEPVNLRIRYPGNYRLRTPEPVLLYGKNGELPKGFSNLRSLDEHQIINIIHIPIAEAVSPPEKKQKLSPDYIFNILKNISPKNYNILIKWLKKQRMERYFFVLISFPRSTGERSQLLVRFSSKLQSEHPLLIEKEGFQLRGYLLNRNNQSYLLERGGANRSLNEKAVSVIGCGSVGGEITMMLAKSGVGELTLIDYDTLDSDNIYRHRLGGSSLNYSPDQRTSLVKKPYKVHALSSLIKSDLPYTKVNTVPMSYEAVLNNRNFKNSDVVVVAVGSPSLSLKINQDLKKIGIRKAIFCWNEAAGVGGHSVALDLSECCYECLYSDENGFSMESVLNLLKNDQNISKNLTGCAGVFTPFSYLDSVQTATLAANDCINFLSSDENSHAFTWKGENKFNLQVTDRYNRISYKTRTLLTKKSGCRICNG